MSALDRNQDMADNKLLEVDRLKNRSNIIRFSSTAKENKLQSLLVGDCLVRVTHSVCNLGVQFDADMTMESHVTAVCKSAIFHLRNIPMIRRYLTAAAT